jgi:hypothetical protein
MRFIALVASAFLFASLASAEDVSRRAPAEPEGMKPLFNGKDLTGWEGNPTLWSIKDGVVKGETTKENPTKGNTFLIWRGGTLGDFELRCTFRIDHGNSGIQYRSKQVESKTPENKWIVGGYQAEIENTPGKIGFLYHERGPGRGYPDKGNYLCRVGDKVVIGEDGKSQVVTKIGENAELAKLYKKSDWNEYIIIAKGNHIEHYINGYKMIEVTDNDPKNRMMEGILALQLHAGAPMVVEFKDVRLKQY